MNLLQIYETLPTGFGLGLLAAIMFSLAVCLLYVAKKHQWLIAGLIICAITPLAIGGFWFSRGQLGVSDWDYYFSYHHVLRQSILEHHTFPLWNPYTCGGTAALADPEFPVITFTFPLELLFGVERGLRLAIFLSVATGAIGMLTLSRRLNLSVWAGLVAAIAYAFGSVNLLEIVEGHQNIFAAMWIPWILYAWYSAYQSTGKHTLLQTHTLLCAVFLALTFYAAGIYLLMYTGIAFIGFMVIAKQKKRAALITAGAGILALGLSSFKLIPVFLWLSQFQDQVYASSTSTLPYLHSIFLGRYLHGAENIIQNQGGGWHEYGAYLGPIVMVLTIIGLSTYKKHRLARILCLAAVTAILISSSGPVLKPIFDQAGFLPRSNISRFVLFAVIPLCLLAGIGIDRLRGLSRKGKQTLVHIIITLVAIDLMTLSYPLSLQAFVLPYNEKSVPSPAPPIAYTAHAYKIRHNGVDYTRAYEAVKVGYGSLSYCSVLGPAPAVRTIHDETDNEILSVKTGSGAFGGYSLTFWNPNMAVAIITLDEAGTAILNTNYADGWYANRQPAIEIAGRPGIKLPAGTHEVTFQYKTPGINIGVTGSIATIILIIIVALIRRLN